jgi:hypothetical protein
MGPHRSNPRRNRIPVWLEHVLAAASAVFVTWFVLAGTAHCAELSVVRPLAIYGSAAGADYLSTRYALAAGAREANPLMQTPGSLAGWKAAQVAALVGIDLALQKGGHKGKAKALRIAAAVVGGGLALHNLNVARRQR